MLSQLLDALRQVPAPAVLAIIAALVFAESALFVGFVFPGETAVLVGGFLASSGRLDVVVLAVLVVLAAVLGDTVGYEVGRHVGPRLLRTQRLAPHLDRVERARRFLEGRGGPAIFVARFTAFLRAVTPALAGLSGMRYRRFLLWNALGGLVWGAGVVVLGYVAGDSYRRVETWLGRSGAVVVGVVVLVALAVWTWRRHRAPAASE